MGNAIKCTLGCVFFLIPWLFILVTGRNRYQMKAEYLSYMMVPVKEVSVKE